MRALFRSLLVFIVGISSASAQTVLTLDQCLDLAHQHNIQLRIAENDVQSAALSRNEVLTSRLPQLEFEGSAIYAPSSGHFGYDPIISNGGQFAGQVVARQSVYDGGIRSLKTDQIGVDITMRYKQYRRAERDIRFAVKQAWIEVIRSEGEIRLEAESVSQLGDYLDRVKQLSGGGNGSYTDVLKTELQLSGAKMSYQRSLQSSSAAKYELAELLGGTIDTSFTFVGTLDDSLGGLVDSLITTIPDSSSSIELSLAALSIRRSELEMELTKHELSPTVSMVADAGLLTSRDNLQLPYEERAGILGYSIGILVEIPLLNWGATDLRVQQKRRDMSNLHYQSELTRRSIIADAKKIKLQLSGLRERLHTLRGNYKAAEDNYLLTKSKYIGGGTLSLEVLSAQQLLTDTKLAELQTRADIQLLSARAEQLLSP